MNFRAVSLLGSLLLGTSCIAGRPDDDALKKLLRALSSQRDVEATLIQDRQSGSHTVRVRTQTVPSIGIRAFVIRPALYSGIVSFDDGVMYKRFDPTQDYINVENSPERYKFDMKFRKALIEKNYSIDFQDDTIIAKRKVKVVFMKGLLSGVVDRRLFIDTANDMILRYELLRTGKQPEVLINTLQVDLWVKKSADFTTVGPAGIFERRSKSPIKVGTAASAKRHVGFKAVLPAGLTAGLEKQAMHVVHHRQTKFLAIRLSDGMAFITVYLYPSKYEDPERGVFSLSDLDLPMSGKKHAEAKDGLRCWVVGDADEALKERLAKRFIRAYNGTID